MLTDLATLHREGQLDLPTWFEQAVRLQRLALDLETGAYLIASKGRGKAGSNKYYLIEGGRRRLIRATSDGDAIAQANKTEPR
jgi:hypothetical protein